MGDYVLHRIDIIQKELNNLKEMLQLKKSKTLQVRLHGIWSGVSIDPKDISDAKNSLIKNTNSK